MAEKRARKNVEDAVWMDETETVLEALHELIQTVHSPIVKTCLEEACEDIAYLTSCEPLVPEVEGQSAVA
jgi:hypothetical protein